MAKARGLTRSKEKACCAQVFPTMLSGMDQGVPPTQIVSVEGLRLGSYGNCVVSIWSGEPTSLCIDAFERFARGLFEQWPSGICLFVLLEPGSPMPTSEQRREMDQYYLRVGHQVRAVAQVVEGGNLWAVMARSVMTALRLVQKAPYPMKVFAETREGAAWAVDYMEMAPPASDRAQWASGLVECVAKIRAVTV